MKETHKGEGNDDPHALAVSGRSEQSGPSDSLSSSAVKGDGLLDFVVLELDEGVLVVAVSVVVGEGAEGIGITALADEPSRRLGAEPHEENLSDGGETLEDGRETPCPRRLDAESAVGGPCSDDSTGVPEGVVERSEGSALRGVGELSDEERGGVGREGQTETDAETSAWLEKSLVKRIGRRGLPNSPMKVPTLWERVWTIVPMIMIEAPMRIGIRRPRPSVR